MSKNYGIDAGGKPVNVTRGDLVRFFPEDLLPFHDNYRYGSTDTDPEVRAKRDAEIEHMVQDLCAIGQKQPILIHGVSGSRFQVHAGDTRHQAFLRINERKIWPWAKPEDNGRARIECRVEENGDGKVTFGASVAENLSRNQLTVIDIATAVALAVNRYHCTDTEIIRMFRETDPAWLPNMRRLARLPDARKREIHLGQMAASIGYLLAEIPEARHEEVLSEARQVLEKPATPDPWADVPAFDTVHDEAMAQDAATTDGMPEDARQLDYSESQVKTPVIQPNKPKRKKNLTARAVANVAKSKGLLAHKKIALTVADMRSFWKPIAEDRKNSLVSRLAEIELAWIEGEADNDRHWHELLAILKEVKQ